MGTEGGDEMVVIECVSLSVGITGCRGIRYV